MRLPFPPAIGDSLESKQINNINELSRGWRRRVRWCIALFVKFIFNEVAECCITSILSIGLGRLARLRAQCSSSNRVTLDDPSNESIRVKEHRVTPGDSGDAGDSTPANAALRLVDWLLVALGDTRASSPLPAVLWNLGEKVPSLFAQTRPSFPPEKVTWLNFYTDSKFKFYHLVIKAQDRRATVHAL